MEVLGLTTLLWQSCAELATHLVRVTPDVTTELQTGLGTLANQATVIAYVDELESRLTSVRAAKLDNLDVTVSSRLMSRRH